VTGEEEFWAGLQGLTSKMDPVPAHVLTAAKESLAWRDSDAALAALVEAGQLATVRGENVPELLTFATGDLTVEIEVTVEGLAARIIGQLVPPQEARVKVDHADGPTWVQADALGRFAASGISRGHMRLTSYRDGSSAVQTVWTLI
jgi:hypothetical protein